MAVRHASRVPLMSVQICQTCSRSLHPNHWSTRIMLARSLFRTDPDVVAFVARVGEGRPHAGDSFSSVMQTVWDRDEHGWTTRALARASVMADWLGAALR